MNYQKVLSSIDLKLARRAHLTSYSESEDDSDSDESIDFTEEYYNLRPPPIQVSNEAQNSVVVKDKKRRQHSKRCENMREPLSSLNNKEEQRQYDQVEYSNIAKSALPSYSSVASKNLNKQEKLEDNQNKQSNHVSSGNSSKHVSSSDLNKVLPSGNLGLVSPEKIQKQNDEFNVSQGRFNIKEQFKRTQIHNSNVKLQLIDIQDLFNTNLNVSYFWVKGGTKGNNLIKYLYITLIFIVNDILNAYFT